MFSVLLLVVPLEGRSLRANFRRRRGFLLLPAGSLVFSFGGLVVAVNGVYYGELVAPWEALAWAAFILDLAVTAVFLFALVQQDNDELAATNDPEAQARADGFALRQRLQQTWWGRRYLQFTRHGRRLPKFP
ncbi:hypothetical protein [Curtobacterium flaccumfaciens]|uniref:hypothetical protein n=1 Tax=Curtobacterium flaccumfaciens TaxID=2035 RepID=UPI003879D5DC